VNQTCRHECFWIYEIAKSPSRVGHHWKVGMATGISSFHAEPVARGGPGAWGVFHYQSCQRASGDSGNTLRRFIANRTSQFKHLSAPSVSFNVSRLEMYQRVGIVNLRKSEVLRMVQERTIRPRLAHVLSSRLLFEIVTKQSFWHTSIRQIPRLLIQRGPETDSHALPMKGISTISHPIVCSVLITDRFGT
jgi:hypothetical protein